MLELADAALDQIALLVGEGVEGVRAASAATPALAVGDLVAPLGDDRLDPTPAQVEPDLAGGVALVTDQRVRAGAVIFGDSQ
ncbi:hypothetical protein GCM10022224_055570 [Nonomuraea antimicrobica]|uniref:Uncharacterized protein n=1 Tax=Nonomuraea antimicrobica TaxID=561173 RepID=A0ABP7CBM5_9ACTN